MSILVMRPLVPPSWIEMASSITLSKLLKQFESTKTSYATVYVHDHIAYVVVRERVGQTHYWKMREDQWKLADHIMSVRPGTCPCSMCVWRRRRQRYMFPDQDFKHLL